MTAFLAQARADYIAQLQTLGFEQRQDGTFVGSPLTYPGTDQRPTLKICLPDGFPYARPLVYTLEPEFTARSWHLNPSSDVSVGGYLCLYGHDGRNSDYPWADPTMLLDRVREWFENDAAGWPDDPPALDMHCYLPMTPDQLVVDPNHLEADGEHPLVIRRRQFPDGTVRTHLWETSRGGGFEHPTVPWYGEAVTAIVVDVGELTSPPRDVGQLLSMAPQEQQTQVQAGLEETGVAVVICRYRRGPNAGIHGLHVCMCASGFAGYAFLKTYELSEDRFTIRSGPRSTVLADTSIAIVGLGAVGSFLADALVRCGARLVDLYDSDWLAPGNCVRHLCGTKYVGFSKSEAVRAHLSDNHDIEDHEIKAFEALRTPSAISEVLTRHWLTIDATADETATGLLINAAVASGSNLLSVCVLGDGEFVRGDRWPAHDPHAPAPTLRPHSGNLLYEAGCGDPVSPTPPYVAQLAAALGCRMTLDLLDPDGPSLPHTVLQPAS